MTKTAVILFNLGGPDAQASIKPFLFNFFMDPNIIRAPWPVRFFVAKLISLRRSKREAGTSYGFLGHKSPLLENSELQAAALEQNLNGGAKDVVFKTFICMRYWHPMAGEVAKAVKEWGAERIVLLPLYPQFSTTTTRSSLGAWKRASAQAGLNIPVSAVCCYPLNDGFVEASVQNIKKIYQQAQAEGYYNPRLLFSAHGLPQSVIDDGDPYQWQCEQSAKKIAAALNIEHLDWAICYQSRVGPMKWIGPSTEEELERAAKDGKAVLIYPHAFTQEHVETLVEIEIEYREKAEEWGVHGFYRVPAVSTHPAFIEGLANLVRTHLDREGVYGEGFKPICPPDFDRCCMRVNNAFDK